MSKQPLRKPKAQVVYRYLSELTPLEDNPRFIQEADFKRLVKSIKKNDSYFEARPIILSNRTGALVIIAGNQRYQAAKELDFDAVPTILLEGLTEAQEREIIVRDNVSNGSWDYDSLANGNWDADDLRAWGVEHIPAELNLDIELPDEKGLEAACFCKKCVALWQGLEEAGFSPAQIMEAAIEAARAKTEKKSKKKKKDETEQY